MSDSIRLFRSPDGLSAVALPFDLDDVVADWSKLRLVMARELPDAFSRDEWAYLMTFLDPGNLRMAFEHSFGEAVAERSAGAVVRLLRRRGKVAIWLPGNVSLLGPLSLILLSLTGNRIRMKGATGTQDVTSVFLRFATSHLPAGALLDYLESNISHETFDRGDPRNAEMAAEADVRIAFGSDEAVQSILALDHSIDSVGVSFADRQSEAWLEKDAVSDELLSDLIKVFAVYGRAGCTSPRRAVILDASAAETAHVRDRVRALWPRVIRGVPAPHVAMENVMSSQCASAKGWDAQLAPHNAAVLASGSPDLEDFPGQTALAFVPATIDEAIAGLPRQIQTIGHGFAEERMDERWLQLLARTRIKRFVPIRNMHHFGPVWDSQPFWRQAFEEVEVVR